MGHLEVIAGMKVRAGQLDGFTAQAAELVRLAKEHDTRTLRYDWFITEDGSECEVHEVYENEEGLVEHNMHVMEARRALFEKYADGHDMSVYGELSQQLRELANTHAGGVAVFRFLHGLDGVTSV